jgi:hypothetical protein
MPELFEPDWRNEVLRYNFEEWRHPKLTVQDLQDQLKGLSAMERYRLYMGVWVPPEDGSYTKPTIT